MRRHRQSALQLFDQTDESPKEYLQEYRYGKQIRPSLIIHFLGRRPNITSRKEREREREREIEREREREREREGERI